MLTLIHRLCLAHCAPVAQPLGAAAEVDSALFGQARQRHGHQHAHHQEDEANAEVCPCSTDKKVVSAQLNK